MHSLYRYLFLFVLFSLKIIETNAQTDTNDLQEVVITGIKPSHPKNTALNIERYGLKDLQQSLPLNLSDALAKLPGIQQMSTGNAISKPIIRGMYGHRILTLLSGLRFDNQQWQDEHGLGLSQIGIESVEIIRGPASILYGTDAMGGVINIIEEKPTEEGTVLNLNTRIYSNTHGSLTDIGWLHKHENKWWRVRLGYESHGDYTDGNNQRVPNSRNVGYYAKAGWGFNRSKWIQNNAYNFSYNQYGFILPDLNNFFKPDARWSRSFSGPHHNVLFNTFSSQNTFLLPSSVLKINAGIQSNKRAEDEGGGEISLNMHLLSLLENAKWEKQLSSTTLLIINQQLSYENNTNLGKRKLVPDASMLEGNLSAFLHFGFKHLDVETGIGLNQKNIHALTTKGLNDGTINNPDTNIRAFNQSRLAANALVGISYHPHENFMLKTNISTGNRMANLAELSSNGLHEGVYRYEIGDPNLKMEQNICADITTEISGKNWFVIASAYCNRFLNYIYLDPTNILFQGLYYEYRFRQQNASIYGGEVTGKLKLSHSIEWKETIAITEGKLDVPSPSGTVYLPFIAPMKCVSTIRFEKEISKRIHGFFCSPEIEFVAAQNHTAMFEKATSDYYLIHFNTGFVFPLHHHNVKVDIACRNLLNRAYFDYLSRLKNYGIYNTGINFALSLSTDLNIH